MKKGTTLESLMQDMRAAMSRMFLVANTPEERKPPKYTVVIASCEDEEPQGVAYDAAIEYNDPHTTYDGLPI
jgi:hypothetical protein